MRYVAGDVWAEKDRKERELHGRPALNLDEINQHLNQLINGVRAAKRAIQVAPVGDGANDAIANFHANLIRQIEYKSHAQIPYTTAFENAVQRSFGFARVNTRYESDSSFDQEIVIEPVFNPNLITMDPEAQMPDGSDMRWCFVKEWWDIAEFKRQFPDAKISEFTSDIRGIADKWFEGDRLLLSEYWSIEHKSKTLMLLGPPDGSGAVTEFKDTLSKETLKELQARDWIRRERKVQSPYVCQRLTNGVEFLGEKTEWPGKYIPIVACLGKVLYVEKDAGAKRMIMSMTRLARDPAMAYCYTRTCEIEAMGGVPRAQWVGYAGQFEGHKQEWAKANHEPVPFLEVNATTEATGATPLPLPQKQSWDPPIQNLEIAAESFRRGIQSAIGSSPLPTQAQRRNEKSGKALEKIENAAANGSYHFVDHFEDFLRHIGVVVLDLIPHIYDTTRDVHIRKPDDSPAQVRVNPPKDDPNTPQNEGEGPIYTDKGRYDVTISTGPSADSERELASEFADRIMENPQVFPLIGPLAVKLKNLGPIGDEIAEALEILQPPEMRKKKDGQPPIPPEVQQQLAQAQQMVEAAMQEVQKLQQVIQTDQIKAEAANQREVIKGEVEVKTSAQKAEADTQLAQIKAEADTQQAIQLANIKAELELRILDAKHAHELELLKRKNAHDNLSREDEQRHEVGMAAEEQAFNAKQADQAAVRAAQQHEMASVTDAWDDGA